MEDIKSARNLNIEYSLFDIMSYSFVDVEILHCKYKRCCIKISLPSTKCGQDLV